MRFNIFNIFFYKYQRRKISTGSFFAIVEFILCKKLFYKKNRKWFTLRYACTAGQTF